MINLAHMKKALLLVSILGVLAFFGVCAIKVKKNSTKPDPPTQWITESMKKIPKTAYATLFRALDSQVVCLKNDQNILPINNVFKRTVFISIGGNSDAWMKGVQRYADGKTIQIYDQNMLPMLDTIKAERIVVSLHPTYKDSLNFDTWVTETLLKLPKSDEKILVTFGNVPANFKSVLGSFNAFISAPENHPLLQDRVSQQLFGSLGIQGTIKINRGTFQHGEEIKVIKNGRLSFRMPEELGMKTTDFNRIDIMAQQGITAGAYPGCQVLVAVKGSIIYNKCFGRFTYEPNSKKVSEENLYDIASITKIASSTLLTMKLYYEKKLDLDATLGTYISEVTGSTPYKSIVIREMMTHQAGLEPFIPFYKRMVTDGKPSPQWFSDKQDEAHTLVVTDKLFMKPAYKDTMYAKILRTPLKEKKFLYSDLCYYFMQPIIEKITGERQNIYLRNHVLNPMGLRNINYTPLNYYPKEQIVPTENDQYFRFQLLWGSVHDPGAAMLGGVAGHAGLFSNATDLASIMQLYLNNGSYDGMKFFDESTVKLFTKAQFAGNKRGIGFDRPNPGGGGTCDELASQRSFGHSGFTGTLAWADPQNDLVFIFLSNRVHPTQDNWKIRDLGIRTKIQHAVYEIVNARNGK